MNKDQRKRLDKTLTYLETLEFGKWEEEDGPHPTYVLTESPYTFVV